ncbi:MAG: sigma 54-interacting transcriptional regulator [Kofleriaceae bacterium]
MTKRFLTTKLIQRGPGKLELDVAELKVIAGPDKGLTHELGADSIRIGSAPDCELVLHDPTVSSRHAEIRAHGEARVIRDLGSKNGIMLARFRIEAAPLVDGMRLALGDTTLEVRVLDATKLLDLVSPGQFGGMVAHSVQMRALVAMLEPIAASNATVLLEGETGTGKEVTAQAIHDTSPRRNGPFVVFDCGAVAPNLIAGELFGHERGAFTGADERRRGLFEEAEGGTLFLDEIGELPLELQPVLLRALERKRTRRVGGTTENEHDVRIVAATNRNLLEEVRARRFREDLYFRLAVARVRIPPLRDRKEDIVILAQRFAAELNVPLSPEAIALFSKHDWPGNVRELRHAVEAMGWRNDPTAWQRPKTPTPDILPFQEARRQVIDDFERQYVEQAIEQSGGNLSEAARRAGISRQFLTRLAARLGVVPKA